MIGHLLDSIGKGWTEIETFVFRSERRNRIRKIIASSVVPGKEGVTIRPPIVLRKALFYTRNGEQTFPDISCLIVIDIDESENTKPDSYALDGQTGHIYKLAREQYYIKPMGTIPVPLEQSILHFAKVPPKECNPILDKIEQLI